MTSRIPIGPSHSAAKISREIADVEAQAQSYGSFDACPEPLLDRLAVLYSVRDRVLLAAEQDDNVFWSHLSEE